MSDASSATEPHVAAGPVGGASGTGSSGKSGAPRVRQEVLAESGA